MKNTIICGNNIDILKTFTKDTIDLVVTSPPYDNIRDYNGYNFDYKGLAKELYRVLTPGGVVVWVVGDQTKNGSETGTSFEQALYFKNDVGFRIHDTMIYEKAGAPYPSTVRYYSTFEYMFIFSKGKPKTINLIKDKKNRWAGHGSFGTQTQRRKDGSLVKTKERIIQEYGIRGNVWRYTMGFGNSDNKAFEHPATFPSDLARDHIITWSNEGDLVLDPMCGSGTTCIEAKKLGRSYIGIDISKEYCKLSEDRLK